jgi:hypothetical protein
MVLFPKSPEEELVILEVVLELAEVVNAPEGLEVGEEFWIVVLFPNEVKLELELVKAPDGTEVGVPVPRVELTLLFPNGLELVKPPDGNVVGVTVEITVTL